MEEIEGWDELVEVLAQMPWTPAKQVEGGTLYDASQALEDVVDDPEWYTADWYFEEPPDGIERYRLLGMLWDSSGAPISWDGYLDMIQVGQEAAYVLFWLEGVYDSPQLLAKVVPAQTPAAYRALFLELARSDENFQLLPDNTYNGRPDLLDEATVRLGFWDLMQRVDGQPGTGWTELRQRLEEPDRGLVLSSSHDVAEPAANVASPLSEAERRALLDRYFDENYGEATEE